MATKTSLIINAVNEGKTLQKAIADVNPQATTAELKAFAQGMLGLTDYTYTSGTLVERTGLDDDDTSNLPYATGSFWFNGVDITANQYKISQINYNFSLAELATLATQSDTGVTHSNDRYKIFIEIRDMYYGSQDHLLATTGGILLYKQDDKYSRAGVDFKICVTSNAAGKYAIYIDIPDTLPSGKTTYNLAWVQVLGTPKSKQWALNLDVTA